MRNMFKKAQGQGNSLAIQWLELRAFTAKGTSSIPGQGTNNNKKKAQGQSHGELLGPDGII